VTLLAATAAVLAVLIAMPGARRSRLRTVFPRESVARSRIAVSDPRIVRLAAIVGGVGIAIGWGGILGWGLGIAVAVGAPFALGRLETRGDRRRREAMERQGADAADLLAACLASGAPIVPSVAAVARALGPPIDAPLGTLLASMALGTDAAAAWRQLASEPGMGALARAIGRSSESGAPLVQVLPGIADDLRRRNRAHVEAAARSAGVKAVAPLAACFLPAFLLVGVVPIVASLATPFFS
jgi:Flp pilus assembly protein TadB